MTSGSSFLSDEMALIACANSVLACCISADIADYNPDLSAKSEKNQHNPRIKKNGGHLSHQIPQILNLVEILLLLGKEVKERF